MARGRVHMTTAVCVLAVAGCAPSAPPRQLAGLWSVGPAACAAGVGVRFEAARIVAFYDDGPQVLFDDPRYRAEPNADGFRVTIDYRLPMLPGGAGSAAARGILVLQQNEAGALAPASHNLTDPRTGSARLRIANDPALRALALAPCDGPSRDSSGAGLRGRSAS